jgi:hypothetical protein
MKILAFATTKSWSAKRPFAGKYFKAEMHAAAKCWRELGHEVSTIEVEHKKHADIRWVVLSRLCEEKTVDAVAFFAHGTPMWMHGAGTSVYNCEELAERLSILNTKLVIIYSCSCGRSKGEWPGYKMIWKSINIEDVKPDDGVAFRLADAIAGYGKDVDIIAHTTSGDTTRNPFVVRLTGKAGYKVTRLPIIERITGKEKKTFIGAVRRWKAWIKELKRKDSDLRYRFPFMKDMEIINELDRGSNDILPRNETE